MSVPRPPSAESLSLLIVDDEQRLREMLTRAVERLGFVVSAVRSCEQAIKRFESDPPDIMILDLNLPQMSGLELLDITHERWPLTQVIILTGFGDLEAAKKAIRLEVVDFLTKPCSLGMLDAALSRARCRRNVTPGALPADIEAVEQAESRPTRIVTGENPGTLESVEQTHILAVLEKNHGNRTATAAELGISLRTLYYRLAEYQRKGIIP